MNEGLQTARRMGDGGGGQEWNGGGGGRGERMTLEGTGESRTTEREDWE